ncbi:MAG TPA: response regulator [Dongiaceae bacterium]|jgi:PAS domain S-box-containing protein|nr:response regulator [Dongiaceae bacterium]
MNIPSPTHPQQIWVIDDDETALMLAQMVLSEAGFEVRTFANAPSALLAAPAGFPAIMVVDLIMPQMDGFAFCKRLRALPGGAEVPVLVTTSLDDPASIDRAYCAGATGFATKPLNWAIEVHRLHYMLRAAEVARELRLKERETRSAKEDWERTFDAIPDVVTVLDSDLRILRANAAAGQQLGLAPDALIGRRCYEMFRKQAQPCANCPALKSLQTGQPASAELPCDSKGGVFAVSTSPVTDAQGQVTHLVYVARDLTEQKLLEAEYRQAQKMEAIGTLAGGIAHDFNNLLTIILGCGELLKDEEERAGRNRDEFKTIIDAAKRGASLSRQLMTFSRKEACKSQVQVLDLNHVIRDVWKMLERIVPKSVTLAAKLSDQLHRINADSGQLEQVLLNLAVNAAHAMPTGGTLTLETRNTELDADFCRYHPELKAGPHVCLRISDTGHGMDRRTQERIYEPFFTTKKVGAGTGLGLSVVFGIVKDHGGHIQCHSEENVGTTFEIYLPITAADLVATPPASPPLGATPKGSGTIMIVDDEAPIRNMLQRFLVRQGYSVFAAADGEIALDRYRNPATRPELVILDLGMPVMSGWECLERLRQIDPQARVLIASGYGGDDLEDRIFQKGALGFINKPYDLGEMSRKVRSIFTGQPQELSAA